MGILTTIIGSVAGYTVAPIVRQLGFHFSYEQNVEDLNTKIDALKNVKQRIQHKVEEAQNNAREIEADVNDWLAKARKIITEDHGNFTRDEEQANAQGICGANFLNLVLRHRLSSRAKEMAEAVAALIQRGENINEVSYRRNLPISVGNKGYEVFESRNRTLTDVMEALRDSSVDMVGLWGMGGVGKTMLAKEVARRAKDEEKLFTDVVFTTISKDPNIEKIQRDIGEKLRMQLHEGSKDVRADRLRNRLRQENNLLIIVDDIWDRLDLEEVGISFGKDKKGCKILLTTRSRHVLANDMDVESKFIFEVGVLSEHEAKSLFRKIVGDQVEEHDVLATQIVKECGGLPIALTTVASALKNKGCAVWKNALHDLRNANPDNIRGMGENVYNSIKFSYDYLESAEAKHLLLLCILFPEDAEIEIRELCNYGFGSNLFEGVNTLESARNRTEALVTNLKDHSLLLDAADSYRGYERVKLHDVIRDVVIFIASNSKLDDHHHRMHNIKNADELKNYFNKEIFKDSTAISLYGINADEYPETLKGPELNLLRLVSPGYYEYPCVKLPRQFLEGLNKLLVLDLVRADLEPLPAASSFCLLPNLQTLRLTGCILEDISWIGELNALKILDLSFNDSITELPRAIGKLNHLLSLNLEECGNLELIEPNVISSLTRLEELNLKHTLIKWEVEGVTNAGDQGQKANLSEVKKLRYLIDLKLEVPDINSLPKDIFSEKLEKYYINIGSDVEDGEDGEDEENNTSRTLKLNLCPDSVLNEQDFAAFFERSDTLCLSGLKIAQSVAFEIDRKGFQHLKHLTVRESTKIRCIVNRNNGNMDCLPAAFPSLESLILRKLINLENMIHEKLTTETSFGKLRDIEVSDCNKLKSLFPLFNIVRRLVSIDVRDCTMMEEIISHDGNEGDHVEKIEISELQWLTLTGLPKLVQFIATSKSDEIKCEGQQFIDAPLFNGQVVFPKLDSLYIASLDIQKIWNHDQLSSSTFGFQNLTRIDVDHCYHLKSLIPSCMTASFVHLRELKVNSCKAMKEIVFIEEAAQAMGSVSFPRLEYLDLRFLPNLERFCGGDFSSPVMGSVLFPRLKYLDLTFLPNLERFCGGDFSSPQLKSLRLNNFPNLKRFCEGKISLHKLEFLKLYGLPNLEKFCGGDISLPELKSLELDDLPNLERFCGGDCVDYPSLLVLEIRGCQKLKIFKTNTMTTTAIEKEEENSTGSVADKQHLSHQKDVVKVDQLSTESSCSEITCLPHPHGSVEEHDEYLVFKTKCLSQLKLWNFPNQQQLPTTFPTVEVLSIAEWGIRLKDLATLLMSFQNLKVLTVSDCHGLTSLFSPSTARSLAQRLIKLGISGCKSLRQVIANDDHDDNINICFSQLEWLVLYDLSNLTSFYSGNNNVVLQFPRLDQLFVGRCPEMKTFCHENIHCPSLDHITVSKWVTGEWPEIRDVMWNYTMEYIRFGDSCWKGDINTTIQKIWEDKNIMDSPETEERIELVFPMLYHLPIIGFWSNDQLPSSRFDFQRSRQIQVALLDHLEGIIPSCMTASLVHLRELYVKSCKAMKEIVFIEESAQVMRIRVSFPRLESLLLHDLPNLKWFFEGDISFPRLESLELRELPNLERFCGGEISSPRLKSLKLDELPNLKRFCGGDYVDCPSLSKLAIRGCQKLKLFITSTVPMTTTEKEDKNSTVSVADEQYLSHHKDVLKIDQLSTESSSSEITRQPHPLGSVEEHDEYLVFKTKRLSKLQLWNFSNQHQLPKTFPTVELLSIAEWGIKLKDLATLLMSFQNLKVLIVSDCHGLTSLFSPSTARSLAQRLTKLGISGCKSLRQVIANDDHDDNINICFSQLKWLVLYDLSNLTSFYSGNNNVVLQFPRLAKLLVNCCPEMKTFCHGNIDCPSLHSIITLPSVWKQKGRNDMWDYEEIFDTWYYERNHKTYKSSGNSYWKGDVNTTIQKLWEDKNIRDPSPEIEESVEVFGSARLKQFDFAKALRRAHIEQAMVKSGKSKGYGPGS